jgi:hypothetical protein
LRFWLKAAMPSWASADSPKSFSAEYGGELHDFVGPGAHFGLELVGGDDLVHQAPRLGLLWAVLAAEEPDLARPLLAYGAGHEAGAEACVEGPDAGAVLAEDRGVGGDREVAEQVKDVAAADGEAVDGRDDGFGDVANHAVQRFNLE